MYGNSNGSGTSSGDVECRAAVTFPTGQLQAIAGAGGLVRISNVGTAGRTISVSTPLQKILSLRFSADGSQLLAAGADGLLLLDARDGREIHRFVGHEGSVTAADISSDRLVIVSTGDDGTVRLWDANSAKLHVSLTPTAAPGQSVHFDRQARGVVAAFANGRTDGLDSRRNECRALENGCWIRRQARHSRWFQPRWISRRWRFRGARSPVEQYKWCGDYGASSSVKSSEAFRRVCFSTCFSTRGIYLAQATDWWSPFSLPRYSEEGLGGCVVQRMSREPPP